MTARGTGAATRQPYVLYEQVGHLLRRAHQRHTAIFQAGIGTSQLTPLQFAALVKVGDEGKVSQSHLGRLTAMDPATVLGVIRRLVAKGLVRREPDRGDRRRTLLSLSPAGRKLLARLVPRGEAISARTLEPLTPAEQHTFLGLLRRLA